MAELIAVRLGDEPTKECGALEQRTQLAQTFRGEEFLPPQKDGGPFCLSERFSFRQISLLAPPGNFRVEGHGRFRRSGEECVTCGCFFRGSIEENTSFRSRIVGRNYCLIRDCRRIFFPPLGIGPAGSVEVFCLTRGTPGENVYNNSPATETAQESFDHRSKVGNAGHDNTAYAKRNRSICRLFESHVVGIAQVVFGQDGEIFGVEFSEMIPAQSIIR